MKSNSSLGKRIVFLTLLLLTLCGLMGLKLADLQIVHGAQYSERAERKLSRPSSVTASRGEILDRYGRPLVTNRMAFQVNFEYVYWDRERQNDVILDLIALSDSEGAGGYSDSLPLTKKSPFSFTFTNEDSSEKTALYKFLKDNKTLPDDPSPSELFSALCERYSVEETLSDPDKRRIIGVRYEMEQRSFSPYTSFVFATDVSIEFVTKLKEQNIGNSRFPGVMISEEPIREYKTDFASNIIGRVGPIYKEEYAVLKDQGYPMDATIGKDGMEKALESYLRGIDGEVSTETDISGAVTNEIVSKEPQPGQNCILTIDIELQEVAETSLARTLSQIKAKGEASRNKRGADVEGGAAVVIAVDTGEILAMANCPTYSLDTFNADYNDLLSDPLKPMLNRCIAGAYPPGSTFKMVTALAGLEEGVIGPKTVIRDQGRYMYYAPSYTPACWIYNEGRGTHGNQNVSQAIENSCNYFFYEVGRLLTIENLEKYGRALGLGDYTGVELSGETRGNLAGPTSRQERGGEPWQAGETIQAAIGQSDQAFSPLQIANYVATIVNGGTLYTPHLLKSVKAADYSETTYTQEAVVRNKIDIKPENYDAIMKGMRSVAENGTASSIFRSYSIPVGGKTGSAQTTKGSSAHGVFVAFAPFDDPEIAVCVIGEHAGSGNSVAPVARDIFDAYFASKSEIFDLQEENALLR